MTQILFIDLSKVEKQSKKSRKGTK